MDLLKSDAGEGVYTNKTEISVTATTLGPNRLQVRVNTTHSSRINPTSQTSAVPHTNHRIHKSTSLLSLLTQPLCNPTRPQTQRQAGPGPDSLADPQQHCREHL